MSESLYTIQQQAEALGPWYHTIALTPEYTTKTFVGFSWQWDRVRQVRERLDYHGKSVLDLGTMDGMWAFEAEKLGAASVSAVDIFDNPRFRFAKQILASDVRYHPLTDVQDLAETLITNGFDIVQCLGLLYHVQNPFLALHQTRRCLKANGVMLLETAVSSHSGAPTMRLNRAPMLYDDGSTYWLPNLPCLEIMLQLTGFKMDLPSLSLQKDGEEIERLCVVCHAATVPPAAFSGNFGHDTTISAKHSP